MTTTTALTLTTTTTVASTTEEAPLADSDQQFPEHEKMHAVKSRSQSIGEFLEWLRSEKGYVICERLRTSDGDEEEEDDDADYELVPANLGITKLLAEFFKIDLEKIEAEKRQMLDQLRAANSQ